MEMTAYLQLGRRNSETDIAIELVNKQKKRERALGA